MASLKKSTKVISSLGLGLLLFAMLAGSTWARNLDITIDGSNSNGDEEAKVMLALMGIPQDLIIKTRNYANCAPRRGQCYPQGGGLPCCDHLICRQRSGSFRFFCGG